MEYTEKMHAENLIKMLENEDDIEKICPAGIHKKNMEYCSVCLDFIGSDCTLCPCSELGCNEAVKLTWLALEEKGYI